MSAPTSLGKIKMQAVLVLYRRTPEQSEAFTSLVEQARALPEIADTLTLLLYDNTDNRTSRVSSPGLPEAPFPCEYAPDPSNPGLAVAYSLALAQALTTGKEWLLLLDQDTILTAAYLVEVARLLPMLEERVCAVVPRLVQGSQVHSPLGLPRFSHRMIPAELTGVPDCEISAYNSGAILRVDALQAIGGFPDEFPLDFLDHAVFRKLQKAGGQVWVLASPLCHDLSTESLGGDASLARYRKVLTAEKKFYSSAGVADQAWYRARRLKQSLGHLLKLKDKRFAWYDLRAALGWF